MGDFAMGIKVHMFPAKNGDCLLLETPRRNILIDGGYADTYYSALKPFILSRSDSIVIDLAIVTHIDHDHISGIITLISDNGCATTPRITPIKQVWHNGYNQLPGNKPAGILSASELELLKGYSISYSSDIVSEQISGIQGMSLSSLLILNGYSWNSAVSGKAVCTENIQHYTIDDDIIITLISPSQKQLLALMEYWWRELKSKKWGFRLTNDPAFNSAMEAFLLSDIDYYDVRNEDINSSGSIPLHSLAAQCVSPDLSCTNASSIAFMLQSQGKNLLFLADATEKQIVESLDSIPTKYFDLIKVPHHGSLGNANQLFDYIDGQFFLISTDGTKHNHPDRATLAKIVTRPSLKQRTLVFNYPNDAYHYFNNPILMSEYNFTVQLSYEVNL